jgi:transposase
LFLVFLEIFVKFKAVSKRAKDVVSFVGICPSPVESGSSVRGKGLIKKEGKSIC